MSKKSFLFDQQGGRFLHTRSVGSGIHWYVNVYTEVINYGVHKGKTQCQIYGNMRLLDCERHIAWSMSSEDDLTKLDAAIQELTLARAALAEALDTREKNKSDFDTDDDDL
jgi:hypothetical protein